MLLDNKLGVTHNRGRGSVIEEFLQRRRGQLHRAVRRQGTWYRWPPARTTSACSMATRAPTLAAWARIRPRPWSRPKYTRAMREVILPTHSGHGKPMASPTGFLYAGLMIDGRRPRSDAGVQPTAWATRNPAHHDAAEVRSGRCDDGRHRTRPWPRLNWIGPPHRAGRGDGGAWLP